MCSFNKSCVLNTLKQIPQFNKRTEVFTFSTTSMTDFPWCCSSCSSFSWTKGISTKGISRTRKKNSAIKIIGVDLWAKTNTLLKIFTPKFHEFFHGASDESFDEMFGRKDHNQTALRPCAFSYVLPGSKVWRRFCCRPGRFRKPNYNRSTYYLCST